MQIVARPRGAVWAAFTLAFLAPTAAAVSPSVTFRQLVHDAWTEAAGSPVGSVNSLAQGRDGYLWVGASSGLMRFDGLHLSGAPGAPPEGTGQVRAVLAARDGAVWAQHKDDLARFQNGEMQVYPLTAIRRAVESPGGDLWLLARAGLFRLGRNERSARRFTAADGLPETTPETIAPASDSGLWLGIEGAVCRWIPGAPAQCHRVAGAVHAVVAIGPDELYAASSSAVVRLAGGRVQTLTTEVNATVLAGAILADRGGNVWVGTTRGLLRIRRGATEWFTRKDGLSADTVTALAEDSEGDVWVGTTNGLDRFRDPRVLRLSTLDGLSGDFITAVAPSTDGAIWVGTLGNGLNRWENGRITVYSVEQGLPGKHVLSLFVDRRGAPWVGTNQGTARFEQGRFRLAWPEADQARETFSIAEDRAGAVWLTDQGSGVWRVEGRRASRVSGLPFGGVFRAAGAPDGSVWLGSFAQGVAQARGGEFKLLEPRIAPGAPRAILADRSGAVWIGVGPVLARVRNGKATVWGPQQGLPSEEIMGIADDCRGSLWLVTSDGVIRIHRDELDRSADGAPERLRLARYDKRDGLRLKAMPGMPSPRIAAAPDGRIWVPAEDGIAVLDPELLKADPVPPPVHIEQIAVDGNPLASGASRFRGHEMRIAYAGLSLKAPDRVRYRYRIDPGGWTWTEVDHRRDVTFVNLPPDHYRFRVTACNLDNVCNADGAAVEFDVVPYFYQTIWAKLLWVALGATSLFVAYRLRLRQMQARFRLAAQERARVTREIHDTLLQGFAGVVYQLEAASRQFETQPAASKDRLERAISQADNALTEARKTLQDMRLPVLEDRTLPEALEEAGAKAAESISAAFAVRTKGRVAPLPYPAQAAMFLIGREAVNNAVNHSRASRITVQLVYADREFRMTIQDDGAGFDPEAAKQKTGHFGVSSMGERARHVGADFRIDSAPGEGTIVTVSIGRK